MSFQNPKCVYHNVEYPCHDFYYGYQCRRCGHTPTLRGQMASALGQAVESGQLTHDIAVDRLLMWQEAYLDYGGVTREGASELIRFWKTDGKDPRQMATGPSLNQIGPRSRVLGIDWDGQPLSRADVAKILGDIEPRIGDVILRTTLENLVRDGYLEVRYTRTDKEYL